MKLDSIFFRVDANFKIGMGHAKRCLVIAQELKKKFKGKIYFLTEGIPAKLKAEITSSRFELILKSTDKTSELDFILGAIENKGSTALIFDSYDPEIYRDNFQQKLINTGTKLIYIAFDNEFYYCAHVLHNQNPLSLSLPFNTAAYTKKLFGLQYLILDEKIREIARRGHTKPDPGQFSVVLLTFGGSDPSNLTLKTLESLSIINCRFKKCIVIIGSMNPHVGRVKDFISSLEMEVELHTDVENMHNLFLNCDVAFTSGGITTWELGALGKPVIILTVGEREFASAKFLDETGWAKLIESPHGLSREKLAKKIESLLVPDLHSMATALQNEINIDGVTKFAEAVLN